MRAHRTISCKQRQSATSGAPLPRPVHVYLLRYTAKEYILRNAASKLRENPFHEANLYISDDVSKSVREQRKKLKERHLNKIRSREDVQFAYIPWSVPARIIFKLNGESQRDKLTPELGFRVGFRVRISSWIFELDFRVRISSWIIE